MRVVLYFTLCTIYITFCEGLPVTPLYKTTPIDSNVTNYFNITDFNITTHLEYDFMKKLCKLRDEICKSNDTKLCAVRLANDSFEYKDFENSCYLFLSNMCDYPGEEFYIAAASNCSGTVTRRHYEWSGVDIPTEAPKEIVWDGNTTKVVLRAQFNVSKYAVAKCPNQHPCAPLSCPNLYNPTCLIVNHKVSNNPKFYTFVNHCEMDKFYCEHYPEFKKAVDPKSPKIEISFLDWTRCGAQRYLKFLYTARAASSLVHYGWLEDDLRYSKILEPWQRKPNYGK